METENVVMVSKKMALLRIISVCIDPNNGTLAYCNMAALISTPASVDGCDGSLSIFAVSVCMLVPQN
jgi:hypothetical protein